MDGFVLALRRSGVTLQLTCSYYGLLSSQEEGTRGNVVARGTGQLGEVDSGNDK